MAIRTAKIVDDLGTEISDAHIVNLTTKQGTISNTNGSFKIEASANDVIEITHQALSTKKLKGAEVSGNIPMLLSNEVLDEVEISSKKKTKLLFLGFLAVLIGGIAYASNSEDIEKVVL